MGVFGSIGNAIGKFNTPNEATGISFADRLGAAGRALGGDTDAATSLQKLAASRMAQQRKAQGLAQLQQILAGQTQPLNAGNPSVSDMVTGQMAGAEGAPTLAQVTARPPPKTPSLRDGGIRAQLMALYGEMPDEVGFATKMMESSAPKVGVHNGFSYDENDPSNVDRYFPDAPVKGAAPLYGPDGAKGGVKGWSMADGSLQAIGAVAGTEAGARAAATAPYEFIRAEGPDGAPQTLAKSQAVGGVFTGQSPADKIRAEGQARGEVDRATSLQARAATAGRQLSALDTMEDLLPDVIAGFGADMKLQAARALAATGNDDATRKVKATETFINQGRVLVADMIKTFGANPTEGERKYAERMSGADAQLNPETLREGIRLQRARINRDLQEAGAARDNAASAAPASRAAPPAPGAVIKGYRYIGGDPSSPRSWQRAQ